MLGLPDTRKGEVPVAVIRRLPETDPEADTLVTFAADRLSDYKVPRTIVVVDELPRTGTDKVAKRELLSLFESPA